MRWTASGGEFGNHKDIVTFQKLLDAPLNIYFKSLRLGDKKQSYIRSQRDFVLTHAVIPLCSETSLPGIRRYRFVGKTTEENLADS